MISLRSLRARTALAFMGAVLAANLVFAAAAGLVLYLHERAEAQGLAPEDRGSEDDELALLFKVAEAMAMAAPLTVAGAAVLGVWLAGRALAPMREAAARARAASAGSGELELPVRGTGDEWDDLAEVTNLLLGEQGRAVERAKAFSANAAHELRTPLAAMLGEVQVALRRERTPAEYRAVLATVEGDVGRLTALVGALLELARADAAKPRSTPAPFDLAAAARAAADRALASPASRQALVEVHGAAQAAADPVMTGRILDNLLDNALRHGAGKVELHAGSAAGAVTLAVTDEGGGFPQAVRSRLFERFNREAGAEEGFGLGLSIARSLAAAQGGRLWLDEGAGKTRLVLELPGAGQQAG